MASTLLFSNDAVAMRSKSRNPAAYTASRVGFGSAKRCSLRDERFGGGVYIVVSEFGIRCMDFAAIDDEMLVSDVGDVPGYWSTVGLVGTA